MRGCIILETSSSLAIWGVWVRVRGLLRRVLQGLSLQPEEIEYRLGLQASSWASRRIIGLKRPRKGRTRSLRPISTGLEMSTSMTWWWIQKKAKLENFTSRKARCQSTMVKRTELRLLWFQAVTRGQILRVLTIDSAQKWSLSPSTRIPIFTRGRISWRSSLVWLRPSSWGTSKFSRRIDSRGRKVLKSVLEKS